MHTARLEYDSYAQDGYVKVILYDDLVGIWSFTLNMGKMNGMKIRHIVSGWKVGGDEP
jgi:hypothetical protein